MNIQVCEIIMLQGRVERRGPIQAIICSIPRWLKLDLHFMKAKQSCHLAITGSLWIDDSRGHLYSGTMYLLSREDVCLKLNHPYCEVLTQVKYHSASCGVCCLYMCMVHMYNILYTLWTNHEIELVFMAYWILCIYGILVYHWYPSISTLSRCIHGIQVFLWYSWYPWYRGVSMVSMVS